MAKRKLRVVRPKAAPKPAPGARVVRVISVEETWIARIDSVRHTCTHCGDGTARHCIWISFVEHGGIREAEKMVEVATDSAARDLRQFFAMFDYPLVDEGDLFAACDRVCGCLCQIVVPADGFIRAVRVVERVYRDDESPTSAVSIRLFDHQYHWDLRERQRLERSWE